MQEKELRHFHCPSLHFVGISQGSSSELSPQSSLLSHFQDSGIHFPFLQENSLALQVSGSALEAKKPNFTETFNTLLV